MYHVFNLWSTAPGPALFSKKNNKSSLRKRRSQQLHGLQWTYSPPYSWLSTTPQNLPNKNFDPPKKPLFQVVPCGFESIQKNVANFVLYFLNLAIFGKIFGKTYFWRKSRLHVLKKIIPNMKRVEMSHEKNPYYFPLYWLVNRDPYNGLL